jgi:hypothetical protein
MKLFPVKIEIEPMRRQMAAWRLSTSGIVCSTLTLLLNMLLPKRVVTAATINTGRTMTGCADCLNIF